MPKLTIDNHQITVPEGTNVLEAARSLGIVIPHFCYHEALGAVGACRLCAMKFEDGPIKGIQMSCMIRAQDGMVVSTGDTVANELRSHVIEWLMMHHPHDCPVCDEGGECQLQDMTIAGGHGIRRYRGKKRTYTNQDLGPFIEQEMNRCITCYRCVRTYRDYCGGSDFGVFGSRNRIFFGRVREGLLESPFAGNLVDVCPTGVFTDKTFRYKSRFWDLQEAPSICPHCSLGCATIPGGRYREIQRVRAGINRQTSGFFICDRGRFGYGHANHPKRPRVAHIDGQPATIDEAVAVVQDRVRAMIDQHGEESVAFLGSSRASFEANALLRKWAKRTNSRNLVFEANQHRDLAARTLVEHTANRLSSLEDIRQSDFLVLIGADPLSEGPGLALAIRQAARSGANVMVIDPRPVALPCRYDHWALPPEQLAWSLKGLNQGDFKDFTDAQRSKLTDLRNCLMTAKRPVLVGGSDLLGPCGIQTLIQTAGALSEKERQVGLMVLLSGPNSFGGALLSENQGDFETLIDKLQEGTVKALVCLESDPFREAKDPAKAQMALGHLDLLVAIDSTPTLAAQRANIFLPSRVTSEMAGCYVNNEGRFQYFQPVIEPGLSILDVNQGQHPAREFSNITPGSAPESDWQILAKLLELPFNLSTIRDEIAQCDARFAGVAGLEKTAEGIKLPAHVKTGPLFEHHSEDLEHPSSEQTLRLLPVVSFVGSDWLAHLSLALEPLRPDPCVWVHPEQAKLLRLNDGDRAILTTHLGHCHVSVHLSKKMAAGFVLTFQLWNTALEGLTPGILLDCRLEKEGNDE